MNYWIIAAAVAGVLLAIILAVVFTRRYIRNFTDKRIAEYQNDLITKHCEEVQNIYKTMRGWRHDYKNHIQVMRASLEMGNLTELGNYLGELTVDLNTVDTVVKTGNVMADAILNSKLALCKARNIPYEVTATIPEECSAKRLRTKRRDLFVFISDFSNNNFT